jgi:hypothetical protein
MKTTPHTIAIRIGRWFEASASGWGIAALVIVLGLAVAGRVLGHW